MRKTENVLLFGSRGLDTSFSDDEVLITIWENEKL